MTEQTRIERDETRDEKVRAILLMCIYIYINREMGYLSPIVNVTIVERIGPSRRGKEN